MVSGAAGLNKVFVLDSNHREAVAESKHQDCPPAFDQTLES